MKPFIDLEYWFTYISRLLRGRLASFEIFSPENVFTIKVIAFFLSVFFFYVIFYTFWRIKKLFKEAPGYVGKEAPVSQEEIKEERLLKWQEVKQHLMTDNPSQWKVAVIEADIMLEQALMEKGYQGETLADMLKNTEPHKYRHLDKVWEAHRLRNRIAHESERPITRLEAERAVNGFELFLRELGFI